MRRNTIIEVCSFIATVDPNCTQMKEFNIIYLNYWPIPYNIKERRIKSLNEHAMEMIYLILFIHILSPYYWADVVFSSHNDLHRSFCLQLINRNSFFVNIRCIAAHRQLNIAKNLSPQLLWEKTSCLE